MLNDRNLHTNPPTHTNKYIACFNKPKSKYAHKNKVISVGFSTDSSPKNTNSVINYIKGAMCNKVEYLLTEMQYDIHNYVFSGV